MVGHIHPMDLGPGNILQATTIGGAVTYYKIKKVDNILYRDAHDALAADGTETFTNIVNLDPPRDQLHWIYGIGIDGNVRLLLKQPAATNRWGTNRSPQGGILDDLLSPMTSPKYIDLWCSENYPPAIQLENHTNVEITSILFWVGKRFSVIMMGERDKGGFVEPTKFTPIQIGGIAE